MLSEVLVEFEPLLPLGVIVAFGLLEDPGVVVVFAPGALVALTSGDADVVETQSFAFFAITDTLHFKVVFLVALAEVNFTVTLMTAFPAVFAVTLPFAVTAATFLLVLINFWLRIFTPEVFFNLSVLEAPEFMVRLVFERETGFLAASAVAGAVVPQTSSDVAHSHAINFFFIVFSFQCDNVK